MEIFYMLFICFKFLKFFLQFSLDQKISRSLLKKKKVKRSKISKAIFFFTKISSNTNILTVPDFICSSNNYSHKYQASSTDIYIHSHLLRNITTIMTQF